MSLFLTALAERQPDPRGRRWLFVPYDQLSDAIGPLSRQDPEELGIVLVETPWKAARRPYHQQKLALVLANLRHFALEQAERGVAVDHRVGDGPYHQALAGAVEDHGPLTMMRAAELELRRDLAGLIDDGRIEEIPHEGWLTTPEDLSGSQDGPPWRMDAFYRHVRRRTGILMEDGGPVGGKYSFDPDNRERWSGEPPAPEAPSFPSNPVKEEVLELVRSRFGDHPGRLDPDALPATAKDAATLWDWAREECLPFFGPFQDAMSHRSEGLFHTRISALLHLHRLLPRQVVDDALELDVELRSKEGFVRQVLGWREFVRHVHESTDGFAGMDGDHLDADEPLPPAYWGTESGLRCLDEVVGSVWRTGYGHHITRLMVLANLATLLDVDPRELSRWFWVAYVDAYDWVVEPNVLGMGTWSLGPLMTTKPYVSGAAFIDRMSDFCADCAFDPGDDCPIRRLYWAFLARHERRLEDNPRMRLPLATLAERSRTDRDADRETFEHVRKALRDEEILSPYGAATAEGEG